MSDRPRIGRRVVAAALLMSSLAAAADTKPRPATPKITPDHPSCVYAVGEPVTWTIDFGADPPEPLHYTIRENNAKTLQQGELPADRPTSTLTARLDSPGWILLTIGDPAAHPPCSAGVVVAPDKIQPSSQPPEDFDAFWKSQVALIEKVPAQAKVTPGDSGNDSVDYAEVTLDNVDGAKVRAQLAYPKKAGKFPALVIFQYAGVYPLGKGNVVDRAKEGWLALNVMAHDLPLHEEPSYYANLAKPGGPLANYVAIGDTSRDTSYFRKMFLGDYQAIEWLRTLPQWNGKVLVVRGESQGGMQSIAMAGLNPHVTELIASVPAGSDTLAKNIGRLPGWPYWHNQGKTDADKKAIMQTSRYYDPLNFAHLVTCPAMISVALRDTTAVAPGVIAMTNSLGGPHELVLMVNGTHTTDHQESVRRVSEWYASLLKTNQPPPLH
ncbi:MAG: acetylxylan esterase [Tepidisphaeraceae bacterium]